MLDGQSPEGAQKAVTMSDSEQERHLIFISYTKADRERVSDYYFGLKSSFYRVWMDIHDIKGGQNWDFEIAKALDQATIVVAFVSKNSIDHRGYVQKELRAALEKYREKLVDDIFLIPVILDDIEIPSQLKPLQVIFERNHNCLDNIKVSISTQLTRLGEIIAKVQQEHNLNWGYDRYSDAWEGLPGYRANYQLVRFYSEHPHVGEITHIIRGYLARHLMSERKVMFHQESDRLNFGRGEFWRTNTYEATCTGISIVENVISIEYAIHTFLAGAAHGYTASKTFVFIIHPTVYLERIEDVFDDPEKALPILQREARSLLLSLELGSERDDPIRLDRESVEEGTAKWQHFATFAFVEDGLSLTFSPYQVAPFAFGSHRVVMKWKAIRPLMKQYILSALGREFEHMSEKDEGIHPS
jgi:hypothetical protein